MIIGRAIQGAGAISAAVTALLADLTREEHRTKAMAMIGSTIGLAFAVSMVLGPALYQAIGVPGMFALTGVLALAAMGVVATRDSRSPGQPFPFRCRDRTGAPATMCCATSQLLRLNFGIFCPARRANGDVRRGSVGPAGKPAALPEASTGRSICR